MSTTTLMTAEQFAQMHTGETEDYELVEGELIPLSSATPLHAEVRGQLEHRLRTYFERSPIGTSERRSRLPSHGLHCAPPGSVHLPRRPFEVRSEPDPSAVRSGHRCRSVVPFRKRRRCEPQGARLSRRRLPRSLGAGQHERRGICPHGCRCSPSSRKGCHRVALAFPGSPTRCWSFRLASPEITRFYLSVFRAISW